MIGKSVWIPLLETAEITVYPALTDVTSPSWDTLAIVSSSENQSRAVLSAFEGDTVAVSCNVSPCAMTSVTAVIVIDWTGTEMSSSLPLESLFTPP